MKNLSYPMIAVVAGLLIASAGQASAGGADATCNSGIAASPHLRATLDERCNSCCAAQTDMGSARTVGYQTEVAASPKVQQMRAEQAVSTMRQSGETASYMTTGSDGITASPHLRSQLDERLQTVEIAPLK